MCCLDWTSATQSEVVCAIVWNRRNDWADDDDTPRHRNGQLQPNLEAPTLLPSRASLTDTREASLASTTIHLASTQPVDIIQHEVVRSRRQNNLSGVTMSVLLSGAINIRIIGDPG